MIFIIDDDRAVRLALGILLERNGFAVERFATPEEAFGALRNGKSPRAIVLDMNFTNSTTGREGIEALRKFKILAPEVPIILITGWGNIELAVEGMRLGAYDFLTKPVDSAILLKTVSTAIEITAYAEVPSTEQASFNRDNIIGRSEALMKVLDVVTKVAHTDVSVLITGENGTGKELIAQAIHNNSRRSSQPFVKVNLGGLPAQLFESEMFGHVKGAFTGATADRAGRFSMADKGTIFLDEIGELDLNCQVKMLRVLQEQTFEPLGDSRPKKVDVRVVSATNANLPAMIADKTFREDLFYRLNIITVNMPPLRERREDIPLLARHFAGQAAARALIDVPEFSTQAMTALSRWSFPGNVRELRNAVERAVITSHGGIIKEADLGLGIGAVTSEIAHDELAGLTLDDLEHRAIEEALKSCEGNLSKAAAKLGITRQSLYRKIEKHGLAK